jgi:hypothetical protein
MHTLDLIPAPAATSTRRRSLGRWMLTFLGFPVGGWIGTTLVGRVDGLGAAAVGGLVAGASIGAAQAWALRRTGISIGRWIAATSVGLAVGLSVGSELVGHGTSPAALFLQGAVCGAVVGVAQALVLHAPLGRTALVWPAVMATAWAAGWATTTSIGYPVEDQVIVFGASGALVTTTLTTLLPILLDRTEESAS